jgi:hypothetical protein
MTRLVTVDLDSVRQLTSGEQFLPIAAGSWLPGPVFNVVGYGAKGDGITDDTATFLAVEAARPAGSTVHVPPGTYLLGATAAASLFRISKPGTWMLHGATLKAGAAPYANYGSDGYGFGLVNVLASDVMLTGGTIDCNGNFRNAVAFESHQSGLDIYSTIVNTQENAGQNTRGNWLGIHYAVSADISGVAQAPCARNVSGRIRRPSCPLMDGNYAIVGHADLTATLYGGSNIWGIGGIGASGVATVVCSPAAGVNQPPQLAVACPDTPGLVNGLIIQADQSFCGDHYAHDLGHQTRECGGGTPNIGTAYGTPANFVVGDLIKSGAFSAWYHYNTLFGSTTPPNALLQGMSRALNAIAQNAYGYLAGQWLTGSWLYDNVGTQNVNVDLAQGNRHIVRVTGAAAAPTINALLRQPTPNPTGLTLTQLFTVTIRNSSAGAITTAWNAGVFHLAGAWVDPGNGKQRSILFEYDPVTAIAYEISRTAADVTQP